MSEDGYQGRRSEEKSWISKAWDWFMTTFTWLFAIFMIGPPLLAIALYLFDVDARIPRSYFVTDLQVARANVVEHTVDNDKYFLRFDTSKTKPAIYSQQDDLWIEVSQDYFTKHSVGNEVGVVFANFDVMRAKYWGLIGDEDVYERSFWGVEQVYDSFEQAQNANPEKKYSAPATVVDKKVNKNGDKYFVVEANGKKYRLTVTNYAYAKVPVGTQIEGEFESIGDFEKITGLSGNI